MFTPMRLPLVTRETLNGQPAKVTFEASFLDYFPERIVKDEILRELDHPLEDVLLHAADRDQQTFGLTTPYLVSLPDFACAELRCTRRVDPSTKAISFTVRLEWIPPNLGTERLLWLLENSPPGPDEETILKVWDTTRSFDDLPRCVEPDWELLEASPELKARQNEIKAEFDRGFTTKGLTHPQLLPILYAAHTSRHRVTVVDRSKVAEGVGSTVADLARRRLSPRLLQDLAAFTQRHEDQGGGEVVYLCFRRNQPTWLRAMITILH